jgi:hypothetical protein
MESLPLGEDVAMSTSVEGTYIDLIDAKKKS